MKSLSDMCRDYAALNRKLRAQGVRGIAKHEPNALRFGNELEKRMTSVFADSAEHKQ